MSETISLSVTGMHCAGCVSSVEKALLATPGVTAAKVSLEDTSAEVTVEPGTAGPDALVQAVEDAGFDAAPRG
jgi:copper chaperone CopZ